ncbi:MAG TPA: hypothetical protein VKB69_07420 [Micromonosporaceae bacterium]|nr:hypothetical protein [Micromonosporaceae bacterium]
MSTSSQPSTQDPAAPRVYRRRSTVITGYVISAVLLVLIVGLFSEEFGHGIFPILTEPAIGLTLILMVLVLNVWPHVIIKDRCVEVHNSLTWYEVPYESIRQIRNNRMGLMIHTHRNKTIPLTGYGTGSGKRMFGHQAQADELIGAIKSKMEFLPDDADEDAKPIRHWETRNVIALATMIVLSVVIVVLAAQTYH